MANWFAKKSESGRSFAVVRPMVLFQPHTGNINLCRFCATDHDPIHLGLDPSYQMTERDIYHYQLAEMIRDKWRDLARALKYTEANIDSIEKEQGSSIKECCIEVLVCWMRREGPNATVKKLASALSKVELRNVADVLMCMDTNQVRMSTLNYYQ